MQILLLHKGQWYHSCEELVPVHKKLTRLLSQYICNSLMDTDGCQKNDFALNTFLQESNFHSNSVCV